MKIYKYLLLVAVTLFPLWICPGQNQEAMEPEKNWLADYNIYPTESILFRYDLYSKEELKRFREKLDLLKESKSDGEWNGVYYIGTEETVNHSELHVNSSVGFVKVNIYTCFPELRYLDYGRITESDEYIELSPEYAFGSQRNLNLVKYVKVKWGTKYLLVEESILPIFAEKAVGIYVEPDGDTEGFKWSNFLVRGDSNLDNHNQIENEYAGTPEFPESYGKFQRSPIEAKIISVGKRTIEKDIEAGNGNNESMQAVYKVTINAGKNKGVKIGMVFDVPEIGEMFSIDKIGQDKAYGEIIRSLDKNKNDFCVNAASQQADCPKITNSLQAKTQIGYFWF